MRILKTNFSNLELTKTKKDIEIINSDDHTRIIRSMKKSLEEYRPDVAHQVIIENKHSVSTIAF